MYSDCYLVVKKKKHRFQSLKYEVEDQKQSWQKRTGLKLALKNSFIFN